MIARHRKFVVALIAAAALAAALLLRHALDRRAAQPSLTAPNYTLIEDGLYMGGHTPAPPPGTTAVLNLRETPDDYQTEIASWQPIPDAAPAPPLDWLRTQVNFIDARRRARRTVFIHCDAGISRSGLVATAYLMQLHHQSRDEALASIRAKRESVRPRSEFMTLLTQWEKSLQSTSTTPAFTSSQPE